MIRDRRVAEEDYRALPAADRDVLAAYARGVNAFIETHLDRLPLEFTLLHYDPRSARGGRRLPRIACRRPRCAGCLRSRSERLHRNPSRPATAGVHAASL